MADIREIYAYIQSQIAYDVIAISNDLIHNLPLLLQSVGLERLTLTSVMLSAVSGDDTFVLSGRFFANGRDYNCLIQTSVSGGAAHYLTEIELTPAGGEELQSLYPLADARYTDNFFSVPVPMYDGITVKRLTITGDSAQPANNAGLLLTLIFEDDCPLANRYSLFVPDVHEEVQFIGSVEDPFGYPKFIVAAAYSKQIILPFLAPVPVKETVLELYSHIEDIYYIPDEAEEAQETKEPHYMSEVLWKARVNLNIKGLDDIWLEYRLFHHGQNFEVVSTFGERGFGIENVFTLIASLAGIDEMFDLPDWFIMKDITLQSLIFKLQKEVSDSVIWNGFTDDIFVGVGVDVKFSIPSLPIPLFDRSKGGGADVWLYLQWDQLHRGGMLDAVLSFIAKWEGYDFSIDVAFPHLDFGGQIRLSDSKDAAAVNTLFPGFSFLVLDYVKLFGSLTDNYYQLDFSFVQPKSESIQIYKKSFAIENISGTGVYSDRGLQLGLTLQFTFFKIPLRISGYYENTDKQLLILSGGISRPVSLIEVLNGLLGTNISTGVFNVILKQLYLECHLDIDEGIKVSEFFFECEISFKWEAIALEIETGLSLHYLNDAYTVLLSASASFLKFNVAVLCNVLIKDDKTEITDFMFTLKLKTMSLTGEQKKKNDHSIYTLILKNFNLGVLIEELVDMISPGLNWYLPWPFKILKQIEFSEITVEFDDYTKTITARYDLNIKILFFKINAIVLHYALEADENDDEEAFYIKLDISGLPENTANTARASGQHAMELLKGVYPVLEGLISKLIKLRYVGVGQHINVTIPTNFETSSVKQLLTDIKKEVNKKNPPTLNTRNNWIVAIDFQLLESIDVALLFCDPNFYGLQIDVTAGSAFTAPLVGLSITALYRKITESIGMFYIKLVLPERIRNIYLGPLNIRIGEMSLAVYTNGNFKIDLGFPYNRDFSRSFGLSYPPFIGSGGLYFGVLNGDTSTQVPKAYRGHFETVVELGIGLSVGLGYEFKKGPLSFGAYIKVIAILEGVFAKYVYAGGQKDEIYYKVSAYAGIAASIYGSVDFVVIKISFSVDLSVSALMVIESYRATQLTLNVSVSVKASIKILFIRINFSFSFNWEASMTIGEDKPQPWSLNAAESRNSALINNNYGLIWNNNLTLSERKDIYAEVVPYFSIDGVALNKKAQTPKYKTAFLPLLHGFEGDTLRYLDYAENTSDTAFSILVEGMLRRVFASLHIMNENAAGELVYTHVDNITYEALEYIRDALDSAETFDSGFSMSGLTDFLTNNIHVYFAKAQETQTGVHGIPFPMPPLFLVKWDQNAYDLSKEPAVDNSFIERIRRYYDNMEMNAARNVLYTTEPQSASAYLFRDYFLMITKISVTQAISLYPSGRASVSADELVSLTLSESLSTISGFVSKLLYGGLRVPLENNDTVSLYEFSCQQFTSLPPSPGAAHSFYMDMYANNWLYLYGHSSEGLDTFASNAQKLSSLDFELSSEDLRYPKDEITVNNPIRIGSLYEDKPYTIGLKNKTAIAESNKAFYDTSEWLPVGCSVELDGGKLEFKRGFLIYASIAQVSGDLYSIDPLGYTNIEILESLQKEWNVNDVKLYRIANAIDDKTGLIQLETEGVFIYRVNLCQEAEKPQLLAARNNVVDKNSDVNENSAYLEGEDRKLFFTILQNSCLVNSKGYYIQCELPSHSLEDGRTQIVFWIETARSGSAVLIDDPGEKIPVAVTDDFYPVPVAEQGSLPVLLERTAPEESEIFQMLLYKVSANTFFSESNDSMPVTAQTLQNGDWLYSQVVPAVKFAKGDKDNPYIGIEAGSRLQMRFCFLDILGNRTSDGLLLDNDYGYTDPLIAPPAYPLTRCVYEMYEDESGLHFSIRFRYHNPFEENEINGIISDETLKLLKLSYWQLKREDIELSVCLCGQWQAIDKQPLLIYMESLYKNPAVAPKDASYVFTPVPRVHQTKMAINVKVRIRRRESLLMSVLKDTAAASGILCAVSEVTADEEKLLSRNLAKERDSFVLAGLPDYNKEFQNICYWAIPPLKNQLISLHDITVYDMEDNPLTVSYDDIDIEVWVDIFLDDFESYLSPASVFRKNGNTFPQEHLESLLRIKERLADAISQDVTYLTHEGNQAHRSRAVKVFKNHLLRNLHNGRAIDAVATMDSGMEPESNCTLIGAVKAEEELRVTAASEKIYSDGILAITVKARDLASQSEASMELSHYVTDIEMFINERYSYLTLKQPINKKLSLRVPLPLKRYPEHIALQTHGYRTGREENNYFNWDYTVSASHTLAAQDTLHMDLLFDNRLYAQSRLSRNLPECLARYIFLRQEIKKGALDAQKRFIEIAEQVADAWGIIPVLKQRASIVKKQSLDVNIEGFESKALAVNGDIELSKLEISVLIDHEWISLKKTNNLYTLPNEAVSPYTLQFVFNSYNIKTENIVNTEAYVLRNQLIHDINPAFVYKTPAVSFPSPLYPVVHYDKAIDSGLFTGENFKDKLERLCVGFPGYGLEISCRKRMSSGTSKNPVYSSIPVYYVPEVTEELNLDEIYKMVYDYAKSHFSVQGEDDLIVQVYVTCFDRAGAAVAELSDVRFKIFMDSHVIPFAD